MNKWVNTRYKLNCLIRAFILRFLLLVICCGCDPATRVYIRNELKNPITVKIEAKNTSMKEAVLQSDEELSFWILLGIVDKNEIALSDVYSQITLIDIQSEDKSIIINKNNVLTHKMIKYHKEDDKIIISVTDIENAR